MSSKNDENSNQNPTTTSDIPPTSSSSNNNIEETNNNNQQEQQQDHVAVTTPSEQQQASAAAARPSQNPTFTNTLVQNIEELERTSSLGVFEQLAAALITAGHPVSPQRNPGEGSTERQEVDVSNGNDQQDGDQDDDGEPIVVTRKNNNTSSIGNLSSSPQTNQENDQGNNNSNERPPPVAHQTPSALKSSNPASAPQFPFSTGSPLLNASHVFAALTQRENDLALEAEPVTPNSSGHLAFHHQNSASASLVRQPSHLNLAAASALVEESVAFAREAIDQFGTLAPMELAMLQAEAGTSHGTTQEQVTAAELLASIERLNAAEFALLAEATYENMTHGLGSHLMYSGSAWYLPQISDCKPDEPRYGISFTLEDGLSIFFRGGKVTVNIIALLSRLAFLVIIWCCLYLVLGETLLKHGGYVFDPLICFVVCSIVGGILGRIFGMPPLVFILGMAILWGNVPSSQFLTAGIVKELRSIISKTGLTIILIRSGLSMSWKTIKPAAPNILSLAFLPMLAEILVHGFTASAIMDYGDDKLWPFLQAMTSAPGASAVVGATVLLMRTWGFGITRGPGVLLLPSVVLDMVLGVWGINFMISLVFRKPDANLGWIIGQGPVQIVVGPIAGIFAGFVWMKILEAMFHEAKVLPHGKYARAFIRSRARNSLFVMTVFGLCLVFGGYKVGAPGGGALACVFMGASAAYQMTADGAPAHFPQVKTKQYGYLAQIWDLFIMPALFSVSASSISVSSMFAGDFIGKAIGCLMAGIGARVVVAFFCSLSYDMTTSERIIGAVVSAGRATVQVALGPLAVQTVAALPGGGTDDQKRYANQVYDTAILGVLIMTPISVFLLTRVAPSVWLTDAEHLANANNALEEAKKQQQKDEENEDDEDENVDVNKKQVEEEEKESSASKNEPTKDH